MHSYDLELQRTGHAQGAREPPVEVTEPLRPGGQKDLRSDLEAESEDRR